MEHELEEEAGMSLVVRAPALARLVSTEELDTLSLESLQEPVTIETIRSEIEEALKNEGGLKEAESDSVARVLRQLRHRALLRVALRELNGVANVDETAREITSIASACLDAALVSARAQVSSRFGDAIDFNGRPIPMVIMGMGKLGGGELNLGSDVDVCFFYESDDGQVEQTSVHDFFTRVARRVVDLIGSVTDHGFVFRVDLRLRPEGRQGPLVNSLQSAERYYESFGRAWERAVWLRAKPVAGDIALGRTLLRTLVPFVYPTRVDPSIAGVLQDMVRRSRKEQKTKQNDVKLGRGGIREAEFFVQALQLIWGGRHQSLRVSGTIEALAALEEGGFVTGQEREHLEAAWALLRRVEHRIHLQAGHQTHEMFDVGKLAESLGFDENTFVETLEFHRAQVRRLFDSLLDTPKKNSPAADFLDTLEHAPPSPEALEALGFYDAEEASAHLVRWQAHPYAPLGPITLKRHPDLARRLLEGVLGSAFPDQALRYLTDFLKAAGAPYARLLAEDERLRTRLLGLFGSNAAISNLIVRKPETLGGILSGAHPSEAAIKSAHREVSEFAKSTDDFTGELRKLKESWLVRIALAHPLSNDEGLRRGISLIAEHQIQAALPSAMMAQKFEAPTSLAVVALGKLGAGELGLGGDLDLIFVHNARNHSDSAKCTRAAQKLIRILSSIHPAGRGFEVDARLRPSGRQGNLVVSLKALETYHAERGESWERQALLRARVVAASGISGDSRRFAKELTSALHTIALSAPANAETMTEHRARMELEIARESPQRLHPKLGYGAIVDVEFITQHLLMKEGSMCRGDFADEQPWSTPRMLEVLVERGALSSADASALGRSRNFFSRVNHAAHFVNPRGDGSLAPHGPRALAVAKMTGFRARDGMSINDAFWSEWYRFAALNRRLFCRVVGDPGTQAPWPRRQHTEHPR